MEPVKLASPFHSHVLAIDPEAVVAGITRILRHQTFEVLRKRGLIVSVSGGIDSSVTAALAARAIGNEHVITLSLPERYSDPVSQRRGALIASHLGVAHYTEEITPALEAFGTYRRQWSAIGELVPDFSEDWKYKIVLANNILEDNRPNVFNLVLEDDRGIRQSIRLPYKQLLEIIAANNHKQRTRKQFEYAYADRFNYAVAGTPNRLEYDQGFFVKGGDGLADVKPIAHLYKTQVFTIAQYLGLPDEILSQIPTTDTYNLPQSQEEFFFSVPLKTLDLLLWALNHHVSAAETAEVMDMTEDQVTRIFHDMVRKRRTTAYLHRSALLVEPVEEICTRP